MRPVPNFLKLGAEQGWLSVVLREDRVDLIHVRREAGRKPSVLLADSVGKGADDVATLSALRRPMRLDRYRCTTLLSRGKYSFIQTDAVVGTPEEARETVRWRLKDQVDFPVDTAAIDLLPIPNPAQNSRQSQRGGDIDGTDFQPAPSDGRAPQVFAALSPESIVAPLVQTFQAAKVSLAAIDLPEISQRNLAALFEEGGRGLATLIFDDDEGLLTFTVNGELLIVRHVDIAAGQLIAADADRREVLFERVALDVQRSLDNFDRIYSSIPLTRLLVASIPGVDGFLDYLRTNLTVPVVPLDLSAVLDIGAARALLDPLRQFQCLRAIGAALRDEPVAA